MAPGAYRDLGGSNDLLICKPEGIRRPSMFQRVCRSKSPAPRLSPGHSSSQAEHFVRSLTGADMLLTNNEIQQLDHA